MRKLFISADMEGCPGVSATQALLPDRWAWEWNAARRWMTEEVCAASEAAFSANYSEVIVADGHGNAHNIDPDGLLENIRLVRSWPRPLLQMEGIDSPDVIACAFIGYHAGPTDASSILAHSFSGQAYRSVKLNGELCSEGYLNAALAGEFGKPVVFISGDDQTITDARRYSPEAVGFVTKKSIGWRSQMSLPPAQIRRLLKESFVGALSRPLPRPFVVAGPYCLELEMTNQVAAEMLAFLPSVERTSAFGISVRLARLADVMRFVSFAMHYSPTGAIAV